MRRRDFIRMLGGAAAWPLTAHAQQGERMRRIGVLMGVAANDPAAQARLAAFLQGLQQLGWTEGRNIRIDIRWGAGDAERNRGLARRIGLARPGRHHGAIQCRHCAVGAADPEHSDRIHACR
jgi:putative tryptophan/tyrosine transport system substrate-binding protein